MLRLLPWVTTSILLYLAYRWIPNRYVPARHAIIGAVIAAVCFELMKWLFVIYVSKVPTYKLVYGAFASVPIFLVWLFLCWLVVLIGAEIAATLSYLRHPDAQALPTGLDQSMARIKAAMLATNEARSFAQLWAAAPMPIDMAEDALHALIERGLADEVAGTPLRYALRRAA